MTKLPTSEGQFFPATPKQCGCCGRYHDFDWILNASVNQSGFFWFNCVCNNTLIVKDKTSDTRLLHLQETN